MRKTIHEVKKIEAIHFESSPAYIQGDTNSSFTDIRQLLESLGCAVEEQGNEVFEHAGTKVPINKHSVRFPNGTLRLARTARNARKMQVLIPGEEEDYVVTYYTSSEFSPAHFDRGVTAVEKEDPSA